MPKPKTLRTETLCSATLLGARSEVTLPELREALEATAAAGFSAVSLWGAHHQGLVAAGVVPEAIVALHEEAGLAVPVVEAALGWSSSDTAEVDAAVLPVIEMAARYGAEQVLAIFLAPETPEPAACVAGFARLCDRAAEHGLKVSLEFRPWTGIPDLRSAWQLVQRCERDNAGLTLDTWHW
ncbi:MAG: TIM barrel protein, partial [Gemmatimonadota bacterium]|nr:TIM barrel protein [Gemmatimonadota bacterium]